jgi:NADH/F420H2 dehydrogenase subunit C
MADDPKNPAVPPTPPEAGADKPASSGPAEPLKGEVSRTDAPAAGASAAPVGQPKAGPEAPKPANPAAATTAATSEVSSATGQPTAAADEARKTAAAATPAAPKPAPPARPAAPAEHKPAAAAPFLPTDPAPPADVPLPAFITAVQNAMPGVVEKVTYWLGDWTIIVPASRLLEVGKFLRDIPDIALDFCSDVTAADYPSRSQRFDVVYCLYSTRHRTRLRVKVHAGEQDPVPSVTGLWPAANWLEREVYDLFGVNFTGHPDRRRILMPEDWQGFPQRKDYPLEGPGELLMENPLDWLKLRQAKEEAEIE